LRRVTYVLAILLAEAVIVAVVFSFSSWAPQSLSFSGSLFVSDAGRSHGGFEYAVTSPTFICPKSERFAG